MSQDAFETPIPIHTWREYKKPKATASLSQTPCLEYEFVICRRYEYRCSVCDLSWCQTARDKLDAPEPIHPVNGACWEYMKQQEES